MQSGDKEGCSSLGRLGGEGVLWNGEDGRWDSRGRRLGIFEWIERGVGLGGGGRNAFGVK